MDNPWLTHQSHICILKTKWRVDALYELYPHLHMYATSLVWRRAIKLTGTPTFVPQFRACNLMQLQNIKCVIVAWRNPPIFVIKSKSLHRSSANMSRAPHVILSTHIHTRTARCQKAGSTTLCLAVRLNLKDQGTSPKNFTVAYWRFSNIVTSIEKQ